MTDYSLVVDSRDVVKAGQDLLNMGNAAESMSKSAQSSASAFVAGFTKIERQIDLVTRANREYSTTSQKMYNEVLKVGTASKSAATSARAFEVELNKQEQATKRATLEEAKHARELERLATKYKPLYAASRQYEKSLEEINRTHKLGVISTKQHSAAVEALNADYQAFSAGTAGWSNQFVTGSNRAARSMNNSNVAVQQLGYQVGDFAVQVQSGQSALVAFSQQATQLVGILPMMAGNLGLSMGAAVGLSAALGIGIPVITGLAGLLWTVSKGSKDAAEKTTRFEDALKSARSEVQGMEDDLRLLQSGFEQAFELSLSENIKEAERELESARNSLEVLNNLAGNTSFLGGRRRKQENEEAIAAAEKLITLRQEELNEAIATADALDTLNSLHEQAVYFLDAQAEAQDEARSKAEETLSAIEALEAELGEAEVTALALAGVDLEGNISAGTRAAAGLAVQLGVALGVAQQIQLTQLSLSNKNQVYSGRGSVGMPSEPDGSGQFKPSKDIINQADILLGLKDAPRSRSSRARSRRGSSSRGSRKEREDFVESLKEEMKLRDQLLGLSGEERTLQEEINSISKGLGENKSKYSALEISNLAKENLLLKEQEELYKQSLDQMQGVYNTIEQGFDTAFMSVLDGTASVEDAFKNLAKSIIDELLDVLVVQKLVGSFGVGSNKGSGLVGIIGGAFGGFFAEGGDVGPNVPIVVGEKEPELFVPRTAGTIYNQRQLSQMGEGSSSQKQQVELIIHAPEGMNIETVRSEVSMQIKRSAPTIVKTSVAASQNSLRNGSKGKWGL